VNDSVLSPQLGVFRFSLLKNRNVGVASFAKKSLNAFLAFAVSPRTRSRAKRNPSGRAVLRCSTALSLGTFRPQVSVRYLRAISTSLREGDGWLAISSFLSALGARNLKPMLPSSSQIWFRKYRFPRR
jgi:hypothetical protein